MDDRTTDALRKTARAEAIYLELSRRHEPWMDEDGLSRLQRMRRDPAWLELERAQEEADLAHETIAVRYAAFAAERRARQ